MNEDILIYGFGLVCLAAIVIMTIAAVAIWRDK